MARSRLLAPLAPLGCCALLGLTVACEGPLRMQPAGGDEASPAEQAAEAPPEPPLELDRPMLRQRAPLPSDADAPIPQGPENPMFETAEEGTSYFGLDVNAASYPVARASLERRELPDPAVLRPEDFVNAFEYPDPAAPSRGDFSIDVEAVPSPYRAGYHLLRIGVRARDVPLQPRPPAALLFVVDVSSSMAKHGRLALLQDGMRMLVERLEPRDRVAIVAYGPRAQVALPPTRGDDRAAILAAIDGLHAEGPSNLDAGLALASELASGFVASPDPRIVVCSDGIASAGPAVAEELNERVAALAERGLQVSTVGVGLGNYNDTLMEQLAERGAGVHAYVDRRQDVRRVLTASLADRPLVVASWAKVSVEFEPRAVARFRRIGYDRERLHVEDPELERMAEVIGAGHRVTALYEIALQPELQAFLQTHEAVLPPGPHLGTVRLRYRTPEGDAEMVEQDFDLSHAVVPRDRASASIQVAAIAAGLAEKLRRSYWTRDLSWVALQEQFAALPEAARRLRGVDELGQLLTIAAQLDLEHPPGPVAPMPLDRLSVLK